MTYLFVAGEIDLSVGGLYGLLMVVISILIEKRNVDPWLAMAMIMVLDKSGSMGGQKIEMTKEAAKAPLALLKDTDSFGVVAFDYNFYWPVKFQSVANRSAITQAISTIIAGGETNIYPALREAYIQLAGASTQVKHVILLSDGRSLPDDFEGLTKKMAE